MGLGGVNITRGALGTSTIGNDDSISGLLVNSASSTSISGSAGALTVGKTYLFKSRADAAAYGITAEKDSSLKSHIFRHVDEFFRMAGEGTSLYFMLYDNTGDMTSALGDSYSKKLLLDAKGSIRQLAIAFNVDSTTYQPIFIDGLEACVRQTVLYAQNLYDFALANKMPCQIIVEGRDFNALTATAALDLRNLSINDSPLSAHKVTLCIGNDYSYASGWPSGSQQTKMADVGTLLGTIASIGVAQNIGEVATLNLTNSYASRKSDGSVNRTYKASKSVYTVPGLSNGKKLTDFSNELEGLDAKGYVFPVTYTGYAGTFWNNDHVCAPIVIDENDNINECYIRYGRCMDKAYRTLYAKLMPKVKGVYSVDSKTGYLPTGVAKEFQNIGDAALGKMVDNAEISAGETTVENSTNLIINGTLSVGFNVQPLACLYAINGTLNLKTSIS